MEQRNDTSGRKLFAYIKDPGTGRVRLPAETRRQLRNCLGRDVHIQTEEQLAMAVVDCLERAVWGEVRRVLEAGANGSRGAERDENARERSE